MQGCLRLSVPSHFICSPIFDLVGAWNKISLFNYSNDIDTVLAGLSIILKTSGLANYNAMFYWSFLDVAVDLVQIRLWHNELSLHLVQKGSVYPGCAERFIIMIYNGLSSQLIGLLHSNDLSVNCYHCIPIPAFQTGYSVYAVSGMDLNKKKETCPDSS